MAIIFPFFISELNVKKPFKNNNELHCCCGLLMLWTLLYVVEIMKEKLNDFLALQNWQTVSNAYNVNESHNNRYKLIKYE